MSFCYGIEWKAHWIPCSRTNDKEYERESWIKIKKESGKQVPNEKCLRKYTMGISVLIWLRLCVSRHATHLAVCHHIRDVMLTLYKDWAHSVWNLCKSEQDWKSQRVSVFVCVCVLNNDDRYSLYVCARLADCVCVCVCVCLFVWIDGKAQPLHNLSYQICKMSESNKKQQKYLCTFLCDWMRFQVKL